MALKMRHKTAFIFFELRIMRKVLIQLLLSDVKICQFYCHLGYSDKKEEKEKTDCASNYIC